MVLRLADCATQVDFNSLLVRFFDHWLMSHDQLSLIKEIIESIISLCHTISVIGNELTTYRKSAPPQKKKKNK